MKERKKGNRKIEKVENASKERKKKKKENLRKGKEAEKERKIYEERQRGV